MLTVTAETTPGAGVSGLLARARGIVMAPRRTFADVVAKPAWIGMLVLTVAAGAAASSALLSTETGQIALVDQQVRTLEAFGQVVDDERYDALEARSVYGGAIQAGEMVVGAPLLAWVIAALIYGSHRAASPQVTFRQVLAVVVHSGVVLAVQQLVLSPINYARESLSSPVNLAALLPMIEEGTLPARFLGMIDLFVVWWLVVLAIGVGVLYGRRARQVMARLFGVYLGLALALALAMAAAGGA